MNDYERQCFREAVPADHPGARLFALLGDPAAPDYDQRDGFYVTKAAACLERLAELDPTGLAAGLYLEILFATAATALKPTVAALVESQPLQQWLDAYRTAWQQTSQDLAARKAAYQEALASAAAAAGLKAELDDRQLALLTRDALYAIADLRVDLLTYDPAMQAPATGFSRQLLWFETLTDLQLALMRDFPAGSHLVGIGTGGAAASVLVDKRPGLVRLFSTLAYDVHGDRMTGGNRQHSSWNRLQLDEASTRFPNWAELMASQELPALPADNAGPGRPVGTLAALEPEQALWCLMLFELMARKAVEAAPLACSAQLLHGTGAATQLPARWTPPFELPRPTLAEALAGCHLDPEEQQLFAPLLTRLTSARLLPPPGSPAGLNLATLAPCAPPPPAPGFSTTGHGDNPGIATLKPVPEDLFGAAAQLHAELVRLATVNLQAVLTAWLAWRYHAEAKQLQAWLERAVVRRIKVLAADRTDRFGEFRPGPADTGRYNPLHAQLPTKEGYRYPLAVWHLRNQKDMHATGALSLYQQSKRHKTWHPTCYLTGRPASWRLELTPFCAADLCALLDLPRTKLPELLQHWRRTHSHDSIRYPWNRGVGDASYGFLSVTVYLA